jgi:hypothetical protein
MENQKTQINNCRIALCGASGSGKSTMARVIAEELGIPYKENSAGLLLKPEQQDDLVRKYGWTKSGHRDVIRLSNINPGFAWDFQYELLKTRAEFIAGNNPFVIDRSPVDNITYFLLQTSHLVEQKMCETFFAEAQRAMMPITHLIFLPTENPGHWVEENDSRIANYHYQRMVTSVFEHVLNCYLIPNTNIPFAYLKCSIWDLKDREIEIMRWLLSSIEF